MYVFLRHGQWQLGRAPNDIQHIQRKNRKREKISISSQVPFFCGWLFPSTRRKRGGIQVPFSPSFVAVACHSCSLPPSGLYLQTDTQHVREPPSNGAKLYLNHLVETFLRVNEALYIYIYTLYTHTRRRTVERNNRTEKICRPSWTVPQKKEESYVIKGNKRKIKHGDSGCYAVDCEHHFFVLPE